MNGHRSSRSIPKLVVLVLLRLHQMAQLQL